MKKLLFAIVVFLFLASTAISGMIIQTVASGGAGGPDVWYTSNGTACQGSSQSIGSTNLVDMSVTATSAGTITQIGVYVDTVGSASNIRAALYYWDGDSWEKHEAKTTETAATGWVDFTLSSGYSVDASEEVKVMFLPDDSCTFCRDGNTTGGYDGATGYNDTWPATYTQASTYLDWDVRIYVD